MNLVVAFFHLTQSIAGATWGLASQLVQEQAAHHVWNTGYEFRTFIVVVGLIAGFLIGLTGVGGGTLLTPFLVILSVPPTVAVGTDLFYGSLTKMVASYQHWKQRSVNWDWVLYLALGSVPCSIWATHIIHTVGQRFGSADLFVRRSLGVVLVVAAVATIINEVFAKRLRMKTAFDPKTHKLLVVLVGGVIGFLVGLSSVGSGSLIAVMLIMISGLPATTIVGTDIVHALLLVTAAAIAHWQIGTVNVPLAANLLMGSLPGVWIGSRMAYHMPGRPLRFGVALLIFGAGLRIVGVS